jgi:hypothetical protein
MEEEPKIRTPWLDARPPFVYRLPSRRLRDRQARTPSTRRAQWAIASQPWWMRCTRTPWQAVWQVLPQALPRAFFRRPLDSR